MKVGIELFGLMWFFAFAIICLPQMLGLAIDYKQANEASSLVVEVIEVHDGLNDEAKKQIEKIKTEYHQVEIIIEKNNLGGNYFHYTVKTEKEFEIELLNLSYPVNATKTTKRVAE